MPRRKRKISGKKSLEFLESPFSKVRNLPSPVFCSDHPSTAEVVNCNNCDVQWVSPQFTRISKATYKAKDTNCCSKLNTSGTTQAHKTRKKKKASVVPLRFVGDVSPVSTNTKVRKQISFAKSPNGAGVQRRERSTSSLNRSNRGDTPDDEESNNNDHCPVLRTRSGRISKRKNKIIKHKPRSLKLEDILSSDSDISFLKDTTLQHHNGIAPEADLELDTTARKEVISSCEGLNLKLSTSSSSSVILQNLRSSIPTVSACPVVKDLKQTVNSNTNKLATNCLHANSPSHNPNQDISVLENVSSSFRPPKVSHINRTPKRTSSLRNANSPSSSPVFRSSDSPSRYGSIITSDSRRKSLRLLFCNSLTPVRNQKQMRNEKILAYDTPEEDYGLSFKQRQIRYFQRKQSVNCMQT